MAGRAAEQLVVGDISTGAADDLARATDIARQIVTRFGMYAGMGQAVLEPDRGGFLGDGPALFTPRDHSEATAREIDLAIRDIIATAYDKAKALLATRRADLDAGTALLMQQETVTPAEFPALQQPAPALAPALTKVAL
jgi:cell division protease FtsH